MPQTALKVGQLAKRTGLSVRTLHYYDEIGLLAPTQHTATGHRLYTAADIGRLQQIVSLRQLGFTLDEIGNCLNSRAFSPRQVIALHLARLQEQMAAHRRTSDRLRAIAASLDTAEVSVEQFIQTIEEITKMEQHFTPEQMAEIRERGQQLGADHIHQVEAEWPQLMAQVRAALDAGTDPADPQVQALAQRWMALVREFTGGNPGIERVLANRYQQDPTFGRPDGDPRMLEYMAYVTKALAAGKAQSA